MKKVIALIILLCAIISASAQTSTYEQRKAVLIQKYMNYGVSREWSERRAQAVLKNQNQLRSLYRGTSPALGSISVNRNPAFVNYTPEELIKNVFLKTGISSSQIMNVSFTGISWNGSAWTQPDHSFVYFSGGGSTPLGVDDGLLLATGSALLAEGPNANEDGLSGGEFLPGDTDLDKLANSFPLGTGSILEFDFIPSGNEISFQYVFASEEYSEFVNSPFADIFGFFISGPGISGTKNLALVPNTSVPVSINSINNGYTATNSPLSYPGENPSNPSYFVANYNNPAGAYMEYDGHTKVFMAKAAVIPGSKYHLKIAISNLFDEVQGSGIFLKAKSLDIAFVSTPVTSTFYWSKYASDSNWNNPANWVDASGNALNAVPAASNDVHIPGNSTNFPILTSITNAVCKTITFHYGAELAQQQFLSYEKAYIQYNWGTVNTSNVRTNRDTYTTGMIDRDCWTALAIPLKSIAVGDFAIGGFPFTWQGTFKLEDDYTAKFESSSLTLSTGIGSNHNYAMAIWIPGCNNDWGEKDHTNLNALGGIFEFPYFNNPAISALHRIHSYNAGTSTFQYFKSDVAGFPLLPNYETFGRGNDAYRFITDNNLVFRNGYQCFKMTVNAGTVVMIGNPFVSSLDFSKFYEFNATAIYNHYYLYERYAYNTYLSGKIFPLQAFFVTTKGSGTVDLYFPVTASVLKKTEGYQLFSANSPAPSNVIFAEINAGNIRSNRIALSFNGNYYSGDIRSVFTNRYEAVSPQIYFRKVAPMAYSLLSGSIADNTLVKLGIRSTTSGQMQLQFTNLENLSVNSVILIDKKMNLEVDILRNASYSFFNDPDFEDRFELRIIPNNLRQGGALKAPTGIEPTAQSGNLSVRMHDKELQVVSYGNEIKMVSVITLQGDLLFKGIASGTTYSRQLDITSGVYIVMVELQNGKTLNHKIILK